MAGTATILLTEDEESVRKLIQTFLDGQGYTVLVAEDAMSAINIVRDYPEPIDMLITDLKMPGMSGKELANRLCEIKPEIKILYISGYAEVEIEELTGCGSKEIHFLSKPFTSSELRLKVQTVLSNK